MFFDQLDTLSVKSLLIILPIFLLNCLIFFMIHESALYILCQLYV